VQQFTVTVALILISCFLHFLLFKLKAHTEQKQTDSVTDKQIGPIMRPIRTTAFITKTVIAVM